MTTYRRSIDTEIRYVIPIKGPDSTRYRVAVAMRGTAFTPWADMNPIGSFVEWLRDRVMVRYGRRRSERKVGVLQRGTFLIRKYKTIVPSPEAADKLADELCAELQSGIRRWE